jgi:glyoxylase-like metal-dependent hydrolase (beta-lactamase superfamily II)/rhodanese-related sulfurtransferase
MTMATLTKTAITVAELDEMIERGESFLLLDVRNQDEFERWKIEGRNPFETVHIPYFQFIEDEGGSVNRVPKGKLVVAVCAKGGSSDYVAGVLRERGYEAVNLEGGMIAWGNYYRVRRIEAVEDVALYQIIRVARGDLAYAFVSNGEGILIDPTRHTEQYTNLAEREGFKIVAIFDTHAHADHISGGPKLAKELGVPYFMHPYDAIHPIDMLPATIEYEYLKDGFTFQFGNATLKGIHIPGHTLGNMAFLVNDRYLFTGDSIFIVSVARPDLGGRGQEWAPIHYESLYKKLLVLPGETLVFPAHFATASREGRPDGTFYDTLGNIKRNNPREYLSPSKEAFIEFMLSTLPVFPPQYVDIKRVNAGLLVPDEEKAQELELGKNVCALADAY